VSFTLPVGRGVGAHWRVVGLASMSRSATSSPPASASAAGSGSERVFDMPLCAVKLQWPLAGCKLLSDNVSQWSCVAVHARSAPLNALGGARRA
jgi:hypothetical protein